MQNSVAITTFNISKYVHVYAFGDKHVYYRSKNFVNMIVCVHGVKRYEWVEVFAVS